MTFTWTPDLAVGVEAIDEQHKELFRHVGVFLEAAQARVAAAELLGVLGYLGDYVVLHFAAEQALMTELAYPGADAHATEHAQLARTFGRLRNGFARAGADPELVAELRRDVCDWLVGHVQGTDRELAAFVRAAAERRGLVRSP